VLQSCLLSKPKNYVEENTLRDARTDAGVSVCRWWAWVYAVCLNCCERLRPHIRPSVIEHLFHYSTFSRLRRPRVFAANRPTLSVRIRIEIARTAWVLIKLGINGYAAEMGTYLEKVSNSEKSTFMVSFCLLLDAISNISVSFCASSLAQWWHLRLFTVNVL